MAEQSSGTLVASFQGMNGLNALRQVGLLIGLAASVAIGVGIVLWSQDPGYRVLYSGLADQDAVQVTEALDQLGIPYELKAGKGTVMVPDNKRHEARMKLASQGLPEGTTKGFELLKDNEGFGVSQFMEKTRYHRALEGELVRTIASLRSIKSARVHLAMPKQSGFLRDRNGRKPSASVVAHLFPGRTLVQGQVKSIAHLVASGIPDLHPQRVTVVDQNGELLSGGEGDDSALEVSGQQFEYKRKVEDYYVQRIEDILAPIVGSDAVRAQVSADMDFSVTEQTQETFNPDLPAVRSEKTFEEHTSSGAGVGGVPGALSNQPPGGGITNEAEAQGDAGGEESESSQDTTRRVTRNYELDRTISHTQMPTGKLERLSVAVVVDDEAVGTADGGETEGGDQAGNQQQLDRLTELVKRAVGFSASRGDSVNIINTVFAAEPEPEPLPEPPLLEQPWVWQAAKILAAGLGVLLLMFGVLRPVLRSLAEKGHSQARMLPAAAAAGQGGGQGGGQGQGQPGQEHAPQLSGPDPYEQQLSTAKNMASQDPKRVAQVMKNWVNSD